MLFKERKGGSVSTERYVLWKKMISKKNCVQFEKENCVDGWQKRKNCFYSRGKKKSLYLGA